MLRENSNSGRIAPRRDARTGLRDLNPVSAKKIRILKFGDGDLQLNLANYRPGKAQNAPRRRADHSPTPGSVGSPFEKRKWVGETALAGWGGRIRTLIWPFRNCPLYQQSCSSKGLDCCCEWSVSVRKLNRAFGSILILPRRHCLPLRGFGGDGA